MKKFEDIKNFLLVYQDSIKYEFITTTKTLLIASKEIRNNRTIYCYNFINYCN